MDRLVASGVKLLVIACNSASAAVLRDARERYTVGAGVPVVEVIQPAVRRAVHATRTGRVGVIGTAATISSGAYEDAFAAATHLDLTLMPCPRFVELVERGVTSGPEVSQVAHQYLDPVREADVDTLVLGCTHYPLLTGAISYVMGEGVSLVSSAEETAKDVYRTLVAHGLERDPAAGPPQHRFLATGDPDAFALLAHRFLGPEVARVQHADAETLVVS
jgi:glutamate racemase